MTSNVQGGPARTVGGMADSPSLDVGASYSSLEAGGRREKCREGFLALLPRRAAPGLVTYSRGRWAWRFWAVPRCRLCARVYNAPVLPGERSSMENRDFLPR